MFTVKYIAALWKKKVFVQLLSLVYAIPIILILLCSVVQMLLPITANIAFEKNADYKYVYNTLYADYQKDEPVASKGAERLNQDEQAIKVLYTDKNYIRSGYNEELSKDDDAYYNYTSIAKLFVSQAGSDLSKTMFTDRNFTDQDTPCSIPYTGRPQIFLSYNTAKFLKANKGDTVVIEFLGPEPLYVKCTVSGFMKPLYDGSSEGNTPTEYNKYMAFPSLIIADQTVYDQIAIYDKTVMLKAFSDHMLYLEESDNVSVVKREDILTDLKSTLTQKEILNKFLLQIISTLAITVILLTIEFNFTRKKNAKDMTVLGMLGMRKNDMKRILSIQVFISYFATLILSGLICFYIYFGLILNIYCEPALIVVIASVLLIAGMLYILLRTLFVRKAI